MAGTFLHSLHRSLGENDFLSWIERSRALARNPAQLTKVLRARRVLTGGIRIPLERREQRASFEYIKCTRGI